MKLASYYLTLLIYKNNLKKADKKSYLAFRDNYNTCEKKPLDLFILHMYSFQNLIRFNNKLEFNAPVGNASYNDKIKSRIKNFSPKAPKVIMKCGSYENLNFTEYDKGTVFYFDPPYLITTAEYNDGKRGIEGWNADSEAKLLYFLQKLDEKGYYFMLNNVLEHQGKTNNLLKEWISTHKYNMIEIGKTGVRYPRTEVLVKNFE